MPTQERQVFQHLRVGGVSLFQRKRLPLRVSRLRLPGKRIEFRIPGQLPERLFVGDSLDSGIQGNTVAMGPAEVAAVQVLVRVEAEVVLSRPVIAAEGATGLDLRTPKRPGVEDQPAPPGRFHDWDFLIVHAVRLPPQCKSVTRLSALPSEWDSWAERKAPLHAYTLP